MKVISTIETKFAKFLSFGVLIITVLIVVGSSTDPVNAPKMLVLGAVSFGLIPFIILNKKNLIKSEYKVTTLVVVCFLSSLFIALLFGNSPFSQKFYGTYGRNTGFLTFVALVIMFWCITLFNSRTSHKYLVISLAVSGGINIVYCLIRSMVGDPIPWNNIYGAFLGTFGNPDFAGAFVGITSGVYLALLSSDANRKYKWLYFILFLGSLFTVLETKTKQGILIALISISVFGFLTLGNLTIRKIVKRIYVFTISILAIFVVLGMLQIGPLSSYLYKRSVSLRGSYWNAAWHAGISHPFTGVGLDSFGDFYRRVRSLKAATWLPGSETTTNSAHNYYLDLFASGGILLLLSYLSFTVIGLICIFRIYRSLKKFDYIASIMILGFLSFQAQAIISISQIGLAIWGWIFTGMLVSYARISKNEALINEKKVMKKHQDLPVGVIIFASLCVGILIFVPPFSADAKWFNATKSQKLQNVETALVPSYFNPTSSTKFLDAIRILENSKLYKESHKYALLSVKFNPEYFEAWRSLYFATNSTAQERQLALSKMKKLDPLNRNLDNFK